MVAMLQGVGVALAISSAILLLEGCSFEVGQNTVCSNGCCVTDTCTGFSNDGACSGCSCEMPLQLTCHSVSPSWGNNDQCYQVGDSCCPDPSCSMARFTGMDCAGSSCICSGQSFHCTSYAPATRVQRLGMNAPLSNEVGLSAKALPQNSPAEDISSTSSSAAALAQGKGSDSIGGAIFTCIGMCTGAPLASGTCCLGSDGKEQCYGGSMAFDGPVSFGGDRRLAQPQVISGDMKVCKDVVPLNSSAEGTSSTLTCVGTCTEAPLASGTCCKNVNGGIHCQISALTANGHVGSIEDVCGDISGNESPTPLTFYSWSGGLLRQDAGHLQVGLVVGLVAVVVAATLCVARRRAAESLVSDEDDPECSTVSE